MSKIIGLDVAFASLGYVVEEQDLAGEYKVVRAGAFHPPTKKDHSELQYAADINFHRCLVWIFQLEELLADEEPRVVFMELPHGGAQSSRAMSMMAMALALTAAAAHHYPNILFLPVTPRDVKEAAVEKSSGSKEEVITAALHYHPEIGTLVKLKGDLEHACDAAMAIRAGMRNPQYKVAMERSRVLSGAQ